MRDQFGRNIDYMRVSVTDRCNLRCIYCMPEEGVPCVSHSDILTFDEIRRICSIGAGLGISRIKLTGGEPLVRRGLPALLGMLKKIPGIEQITLTTNGILLKDNINELVSNGLDAVNISIDTLDPEYYHKITRRGGIEEVLSALDAALSYPALKVKVNCVPLKGMPEETYVQLASLAKSRDVDVRFIGQSAVMESLGTDRPYMYSFPDFTGKSVLLMPLRINSAAHATVSGSRRKDV